MSDKCGSFGCGLPAGHNMGRADIPEHHQPKSATVCVRLDGLADKIAAAVHDGWCSTGCPFPNERDNLEAAVIVALLQSLAVQ